MNMSLQLYHIGNMCYPFGGVFAFYKRQLWDNENDKIGGQEIWVSLPALLHASNFSSIVLVSSCVKEE